MKYEFHENYLSESSAITEVARQLNNIANEMARTNDIQAAYYKTQIELIVNDDISNNLKEIKNEN